MDQLLTSDHRARANALRESATSYGSEASWVHAQDETGTRESTA